MKPGDLVEFAGEYHHLSSDGRMNWVVSPMKKTGIIISSNNESVVVLCNKEEYHLCLAQIKQAVLTSITVISSA
jgi:hypothetical protein